MLLCRSCCRQPVLSRTGMPCLLQQYEVIRKAAEKRENSSVWGIEPIWQAIRNKNECSETSRGLRQLDGFPNPSPVGTCNPCRQSQGTLLWLIPSVCAMAYSN